MRHHSVTYILKNLIENKVLLPYLLTNPHAIGLTDYCIFFNCISESKNTRKKIINFCLSSDQVAYFAELTGPYRYSVSLFCRTVFEVEDFFKKLNAVIPGSSFDMSFAIRLRFTQILGNLWKARSRVNLLDRTRTTKESAIDEVDRKILAFYSQNADLSLQKIALLVGTSESTIRYRLKSLEERGTILAYAYFLDNSKIGISTHRVVISAKSLNDSFYKAIYSYMQKHPCAAVFVHCAGSWDFELSFDLEDPSDFGEIIGEIDDNFGANIRKMQTFNEIITHRAHHFPLSAGISK